MKKIIICFIVIIGFYLMIGSVSSFSIPKDALRIRIIPNSNNPYDQEIKNIIKDNIQTKLYELLKNAKGSKEARKIINDNLNYLDKEVKKSLSQLNYDLGYDINYGLNYFPSKEYKGITYDEGYYESLVITLGSGQGDNWWCVLFPPLCLLEGQEDTKVEYTSYVKELIKKYL
ncbi:MAG: stage II sporulation protein R [Bacilli bacterium]